MLETMLFIGGMGAPNTVSLYCPRRGARLSNCVPSFGGSKGLLFRYIADGRSERYVITIMHISVQLCLGLLADGDHAVGMKKSLK